MGRIARTDTRAELVALTDQIVAMLKSSAPVPMSTSEIIDQLPLIKGHWERPHNCPNCSCEPKFHKFFHSGCRQHNGRVTGITKRLEKQGLVERFHTSVRGQPDGWRWIGEA